MDDRWIRTDDELHDVIVHRVRVGEVEYRIASWPRGVGWVVGPMGGWRTKPFVEAWSGIARRVWPEWVIVVRLVDRNRLMGKVVHREVVPRSTDRRARMNAVARELRKKSGKIAGC